MKKPIKNNIALRIALIALVCLCAGYAIGFNDAAKMAQDRILTELSK